MREIKFRGEKVDNGERIVGFLELHLVNGDLTKTKQDAFITYDYMDKIGKVYRDRFDVIPESVSQFTGLHDKNGKEIYEGDIVDHFGLNIKNEVIFKDGAFGYNHEHNSFISYAENSWFQWKEGKSEEIEVNGNIYESSEAI